MSIEPVLSAIPGGFTKNRNLGIWILGIHVNLHAIIRVRRLTIASKRLRMTCRYPSYLVSAQIALEHPRYLVPVNSFMVSRIDLPFLHFGIFFNGQLEKLV